MKIRKSAGWNWSYPSFLLVLLTLAPGLNHAFGAIIPSARSIDWSQVGVPGGVPNITNVFTNLTGIDNTGATDASAAINSAIASCPAGQAVVLPAGTFLINSTINMHNRVVLRGQGANTILSGSTSLQVIINYQGGRWYDSMTNVIAGFGKGSTNLVLGGLPADLQVGMQVQIQQNNDPSLVNPVGIDGSAGDWAVGQWVEVKAIANNLITVWPPLYYNYSSTFNPRIRYDVDGSNPNRNFIEYAGLESLVVGNNNPNCSANISMNWAAYCWVKNVASLNAGVCHVWPYNTYRCEIRDSTFQAVLAPITSSRGYGLQTGTPESGLPCDKTTAMLIENNVWSLCRGDLVLGYGASGCVIGYNYFASVTNETPTIEKMDVSLHSAHSYMNLFEGNVGTKINADDFHGSSSHNTIFRNYWRGRETNNPVVVSSLTSIELDSWQRYYNIVGNVLGYPTVTQEMAQLANPTGGELMEAIAPAANWSYGNWYKALMFGYAGEGGGAGGDDTNVVATVILTGNFDYVSGQVNWDANGVQTLPPSLYLAGLPSWWPDPTSTPWPPIGSDLTNMVGMIPAQARSLGIVLLSQTNSGAPVTSVTPPPPPQGLHILH